ncbi:hypothetical protein MUY35_04505 [Aliiroseovarius sp. S1339]|uniref:hypothetical protein n=1 Tax=Aliiroseovarius sp. S1339 TaxID=2936990 RepID=UPI0020C14E89|nr:hypothetical protein [Aliiroseovarius sp. S1339]MCK8463107.1 hypothetical protein [Aliiroseovarius sp. S1339]
MKIISTVAVSLTSTFKNTLDFVRPKMANVEAFNFVSFEDYKDQEGKRPASLL